MCCGGLRSLSLARCRRVSEGCVAQLCMSLPRLESLDLSHCRQLGDVAAAAALRHCEELRTLWLDGTRVRGERPDPDDPGAATLTLTRTPTRTPTPTPTLTLPLIPTLAPRVPRRGRAHVLVAPRDREQPAVDCRPATRVPARG